MTISEMNEFIRFCGGYFPGAKRLRDAEAMRVYYRHLKPFELDDCKGALVSHVADGNNYLPDIAELLGRLPENRGRVDLEGYLKNAAAYAAVIGVTAPEFKTAEACRRWFEEAKNGAV